MVEIPVARRHGIKPSLLFGRREIARGKSRRMRRKRSCRFLWWYLKDPLPRHRNPARGPKTAQGQAGPRPFRISLVWRPHLLIKAKLKQ